MKNMEGSKIPSVTFRVREGASWKDVTTESIFKGKRVVVFSLPGAFTPTCSTSHLPRYNELVRDFKKLGVDTVACLSVNDTFVMNAWKADQKADEILMLPDGNGEFSEKLGMLVDKKGLGFGKRSWRYSMLVDDGVIKKMFIEPEMEGDPFQVSDADTMIKYLDSSYSPPESVVIFTKVGCSHCAKAKEMLKANGYLFEEIVIDRDVPARVLRGLTGSTTAPQIFMGGKWIGGNDALEKRLVKAA